MGKKKNDLRTYAWVIVIVGLLAVLAVFSGLFSIAEIVDTSGTYKSVSSAMSGCEADRVSIASSAGLTCDACKIVCPTPTGCKQVTSYSGNTFNFDYTATGGIYKGVFTGVQCDYIGSSNPSGYNADGCLLQVKSYCHDTIRLCERQVGTGSVQSTQQVTGGKIDYIKYSSETYDCASGKTVSASSPTYKYQITCSAGYTLSGTKISAYSTNLGKCVKESTILPINFGGTFSDNVQLQNAQVDVNTEADIIGSFTATQAGKYYIYAEIDKTSAVPLSIAVSGQQDLCGNNPLVAGTFADLQTGETATFTLSIQAPSDGGTYKVNVKSRGGGCAGSDVNSVKTLSLKVVPKVLPPVVEQPIAVPIVEQPTTVCNPDNFKVVTSTKTCLLGECQGDKEVNYPSAKCTYTNGTVTTEPPSTLPAPITPKNGVTGDVVTQLFDYKNNSTTAWLITIGIVVIVLSGVYLLFGKKEKTTGGF
jgi:hypothetical protein